MALWVPALVFVAFHLFWPDNDTWRTYTFDAELAAIESVRAIPDNENAAILYQPLLDSIDLNAVQPEFLKDRYFLPSDQPWTESEYPEVEAWLNSHANIMESLPVISQMDQCRFPVQPGPFAETSDRYKKLKLCTKLLWVSAKKDIDRGSIEPALKKYSLAMQIAGHCYQQPNMMDFFTGSHIEKKTLSLIRKLIVQNDPTDKELHVIRKMVNQQDNWPEQLQTILAGEKLREKNSCGYAYEVNDSGKVRFNRHLFGDDTSSRWEKYFGGRFIAIAISLLVPYSPEKVSRTIDNVYENYYQMASPGFNQDKLQEYERKIQKQLRPLRSMRLVHMFCTTGLTLPNTHNCYIRLLAQRRASRLFIGLRVYKNKNNTWPKTLDDIESSVPAEALIDPINNSSFVYKLTDDNFTFYSKGKNNIDENGQYKYNRKTNEAKPDDRLIWPPEDKQKQKK